MISDEDMKLALDRIARSEDGNLLYRFFQQVLCGVVLGANDGALREDNGRRRFASELMGHMAKGIEESGGTDAIRRPVIFARRQPDAGHKHVSAREWLASQSEPADR